MSEWTAEAIAEEQDRRQRLVRTGWCPDSGLPLWSHQDGIVRCSICDCNGYGTDEVTS